MGYFARVVFSFSNTIWSASSSMLRGEETAVGQHVGKFADHAFSIDVWLPLKALQELSRLDDDRIRKVLGRMELVPVSLLDELAKGGVHGATLVIAVCNRSG